MDMDFTSENEAYIQDLLKQVTDETLKVAEVECTRLYKESIQNKVYDMYDPVEYERTEQLKNNVNSHINSDGELYIFNDNNWGNYFSAVNGSDQSVNVAKWIEDGHHDSTGIMNEYHNYDGREFLEDAKQRIDTALDIDCEIIKDWE